MNCVNHPELTATAFCRTCGKALCVQCQRPSQGTIFCEEHMVVAGAGQTASGGFSPYTTPNYRPPDPGVSPGLAFVLGLIPGVGAIYNAQYAKGVIHVIILGLLISIQSSGAAGGLEPVFGLLTAAFFFYQAFEAYHTAKKRQMGQPVDEYSSILPMGLRPQGAAGPAGFPVGPVVMISVGVVFLLNNLGLLHIRQIIRYWPVFLIAFGVYLLYSRVAGDRNARSNGLGGGPSSPSGPEPSSTSLTGEVMQ